MDIVDLPTKRQLPERTQPITAVILHTTGSTDLDAIINWYTSKDGLQPHYMISVSGLIRRFVQEDHVAYHCKIDQHEAKLYMLGYKEWSHWCWDGEKPFNIGNEFSGYRMWRDQWRTRGKQSPLELISHDHPNSCSIGIELQQPTQPTPDIFTDEQYRSCADLLADIWRRQKVPLDREHVLSHYDCSPMRRCNPGGSTDPGRNFNYNRIWDLLGIARRA